MSEELTAEERDALALLADGHEIPGRQAVGYLKSLPALRSRGLAEVAGGNGRLVTRITDAGRKALEAQESTGNP